MKILSLGPNKLAISFGDIAITIGDKSYTHLTFVVRLLTLSELIRLNSLNTDNVYHQMIIEEELYETSLYQIVGIDEKIDFDTIESGIISTIASIIINQSNFYLSNLEDGIDKEKQYINIFDQIELMVIKHFNMTYSEVNKLSIDDLIKKFTIAQITFPNESLTFEDKEN